MQCTKNRLKQEGLAFIFDQGEVSKLKGTCHKLRWPSATRLLEEGQSE